MEKPSSEPAFLLEEPIDILTSGRYHAVPFLIGYNDREGMLLELIQNRKGNMEVMTDFEEAIPYTMKLEQGSGESRKIARLIKEFYYSSEMPSLENIDKYYAVSICTFCKVLPMQFIRICEDVLHLDLFISTVLFVSFLVGNRQLFLQGDI